MSAPAQTVRAAVAQIAPVVLDGPATVEKACDWIRRAGREGAKIVAFPETIVAGYPLWCDGGTFGSWNDAAAKEVHARLIEGSIGVPSPATERIAVAARESGVVVSIGVNERDARARGDSGAPAASPLIPPDQYPSRTRIAFVSVSRTAGFPASGGPFGSMTRA